MIGLTLTAFALIAPRLIARTQLQASEVAQLYQAGSVKLGQLLSVVYHYEGSVPFKIGLYNYGSQPITLLYVFLSTSAGQCKEACQCTWSLAPAAPIVPNSPVQLNVIACTDRTGSPVVLTSISTYQLFLYSTGNLGYAFTL